MPLDKAVKVFRVSDQTRFTDGGGTMKVYVYEFRIGTHGPFSEEFGYGEHHPDAVARRINEKVAKLRELGIVEPAGA
jgi:hypothetical protein